MRKINNYKSTLTDLLDDMPVTSVGTMIFFGCLVIYKI